MRVRVSGCGRGSGRTGEGGGRADVGVACVGVGVVRGVWCVECGCGCLFYVLSFFFAFISKVYKIEKV